MGGQFGEGELEQIFVILVKSGKTLKDLLQKSPLLALEDVWSLFAVVKAGVDLKLAASELLELDGEDKAKFLASVERELPELGMPELEVRLAKGAQLLSRVDDWVRGGIELAKEVVELVK